MAVVWVTVGAMMFTAQMEFFAKISDPMIGGTLQTYIPSSSSSLSPPRRHHSSSPCCFCCGSAVYCRFYPPQLCSEYIICTTKSWMDQVLI